MSYRGCLLFIMIALGLLFVATEGAEAGSYDCQSCHPRMGLPTFHTASRLICSKCHTMHYSEDDAPPAGADANGPFKSLLLKSNHTDLCLTCHKAPFNGTGAPIVLTTDGSMGTNYPAVPGGDFYYASQNDGKGHNPGGADIGADGVLSQSPGGNFSATKELCTSCHDPHGGSGANAYRLLKKKPGDWAGADLVVSGTESHPGSDESASEYPQYVSGFSAWCGACHGGFHGSTLDDTDVGDGTNWLRHPTDRALGTEIAANYTTAYDWRYPVEDVDQSGDVGSTDEVFCLSCHRAHATDYGNATRWDNMTASGSGTGCNKCHKKGS